MSVVPAGGQQRAAAPKQLSYNPANWPMSIPAESKTVKFLPSGGNEYEYGKTSVVSIDINSNSYLATEDSYLQFTLQNMCDGPVALECGGGAACLQRVLIKSGGTVLSDISEYGRLHALLYDTQTNDRSSTGTILSNEQGCFKATMKPASVSGTGQTPTSATDSTIQGTMTPKPLNLNTAAVGGQCQFPVWSGDVTTATTYPCPHGVGVVAGGSDPTPAPPDPQDEEGYIDEGTGDGNDTTGTDASAEIKLGDAYVVISSKTAEAENRPEYKQEIICFTRAAYSDTNTEPQPVFLWPGLDEANWTGDHSLENQNAALKKAGFSVEVTLGDGFKRGDETTLTYHGIDAIKDHLPTAPNSLAEFDVDGNYTPHLADRAARLQAAGVPTEKDGPKNKMPYVQCEQGPKGGVLAGNRSMQPGGKDNEGNPSHPGYFDVDGMLKPEPGPHDDEFTYCIPLVNSILNSDVYLPLLLTTAGITLELHLARPENVGVAYKNRIALHDCTTPYTKWGGIDDRTPEDGHVRFQPVQNPYQPFAYKLKNVQYVAKCITLTDQMDSILRAQVAQQGAISIHSNAYKHFSSTFGSQETEVQVPLMCRMKSIKSIITTLRPQEGGCDSKYGADDIGPDFNGKAAGGDNIDEDTLDKISGMYKAGSRANPFSSINGVFRTTPRHQMGVEEVQLSIGSALWPEVPIKADASGYCGNYLNDPMQKWGSGTAQLYMAHNQAFGLPTNGVDTHTSLTRTTYSCTGNTGQPGPGDYAKQCVLAIDLQSFSRSAVENGVDSASRALNLSLHLRRQKSVGDDSGKPLTNHKDGLKQSESDDEKVIQALGASGLGNNGAYMRRDKVLEQICPSLSYVRNRTPAYVQVDSWCVGDCWTFIAADGSITTSL